MESSLLQRASSNLFLFNQAFVSGNPNVILTWRTWGQRLSRVKVAWSKRRALAFYFSMRIWHMFLMSKWRGEGDFAWSMHLSGTCQKNAVARWRLLKNLRPNAFFNRRSPPRNRLSLIFLQVTEKCIKYQRICWLKQKLFRWNALYTGFHWETAFVREILNCTLTDLEQTIAFGV